MKHPIYRENSDRGMMLKLKELGSSEKLKSLLLPVFENSNSTEGQCHAFVNRINTLIAVEESGCVLIQLKESEHWNESMSEKTIKKMSVDDIVMPYTAFTIDLTSAAWSKYEYVHVLKNDGNIVFTFEAVEEGGIRYHQMNLDSGKNIGSEIDTILALHDLQTMIDKALGKDSDNMREIIYKCISIIMFTSMFQKVTDKVLLHKVVNKGSKKRNIPNHTTSIIYLSQPSYRLTGKNKPTAHGASDKTWLQRGHFRRQPYGNRSAPQYRSIWIEMMWKGSGSKVLEKIIKV